MVRGQAAFRLCNLIAQSRSLPKDQFVQIWGWFSDYSGPYPAEEFHCRGRDFVPLQLDPILVKVVRVPAGITPLASQAPQ